MKAKNLLFIMISLIAVTTGCKSTEIDTNLGKGSMTFDGKTYTLNHLAMATTHTSDNLYTHNAIIREKGNQNIVFSFSVKDDNARNEINVGSYNTTIHGDYTARFSTSTEGDSLEGVLKVSASKDEYTFSFEGTTVDETTPSKTVVVTYTGKISN
ncbi:hypothetical protein D0T49_08895 [Paludibacter sp. 221]|uniref:hypothetical protein n=1 Tax=Paludibacter sp. 221 TaxID=2302939 RepID=UPI0013D857F1|nr:hypothetical protein [Paludibacter sp. 221]NDV47160.1 hypothetical protein [Paludibacter sp. 221]